MQHITFVSEAACAHKSHLLIHPSSKRAEALLDKSCVAEPCVAQVEKVPKLHVRSGAKSGACDTCGKNGPPRDKCDKWAETQEMG